MCGGVHQLSGGSIALFGVGEPRFRRRSAEPGGTRALHGWAASPVQRLTTVKMRANPRRRGIGRSDRVSCGHGPPEHLDHPDRQALAAPSEPGRPAAVRDAMDIIEGGPHLPLTTSTLARQCHVSVRTLQEGFPRHLGMSPMAYVRVVRLRRAQRDLRSADPFHSTVSAIAHCWGSLTSAALSAAGETDPGAAAGVAPSRWRGFRIHISLSNPTEESLAVLLWPPALASMT
jgi:AraC-like DNA-binding protein